MDDWIPDTRRVETAPSDGKPPSGAVSTPRRKGTLPPQLSPGRDPHRSHALPATAHPRRRRGTWIRDLERGAPPPRPRPARGSRRGGGLHVRARLGPLPPLDRPSGSEPFRLGHAGRDRAGHRAAGGRHGRHVPDNAPPPRDRRARRRDRGLDAPRPVLPGRRDGREPERARPGATLARSGRSARDAGGGDRGDAPALARRAREPPWPALHGGEREALHAPRRADRRHGRGRRTGGRGARRPRRRRPGRHGARSRRSSSGSTRQAGRGSRGTGSSRCAGQSARTMRVEPPTRGGRTRPFAARWARSSPFPRISRRPPPW